LTKILNEFPCTVLRIICDGNQDYLDSLKSLATERGLTENVEFLGYISNPKEVMAQSDLFLMCSRNEAFGRVTVEAMSVGCPVVGANSGGTKEIISSNDCGRLYEPGNTKQLADEVISLLSAVSDRVRLSKQGVLRSNAFSMDDCIGKIERVLCA
jgi:glycosyltransferase involved in cell wall biosynthesis